VLESLLIDKTYFSLVRGVTLKSIYHQEFEPALQNVKLPVLKIHRTSRRMYMGSTEWGLMKYACFIEASWEDAVYIQWS
jgi:hypothetical protein